jgi:plasmid maintenance system killer protein
MTGWDILNTIINGFSPIAMALMLAAALVAVILFIAGFSKHGIDFIRHGFGQNLLNNELMANLATKEDIAMMRIDISKLETDLETIKVNHFGHLKDFLTELTSILVDKDIINNENKTRLDNQLRGM